MSAAICGIGWIDGKRFVPIVDPGRYDASRLRVRGGRLCAARVLMTFY